MRAAMIAPNGRVLSIIDVQDFALAQLGVPAPNFLLGVTPPSMQYYWDGGKYEPIGDSPNQFSYFDYNLREWVDPRSIEEFKDQKWAEIKSLRDQIEFGGFEFEGNIYDSDQVSQGRIMGAASAQVDQIWTLANNEMVELTAIQLSQLYQTLQAHIANIHERGRIARQLIYEATTIEQVEEITL